MSLTRTATTRELASFLSALRFDDLPDEVVERTKELFLDWVASALAGKNARPVRIFEQFAETMGPAEGPSEILPSRRRASPFFAALVNGAASHVVEQDDLHNASVFHRSEEHTSELQSRQYLVCRLLLEKKKAKQDNGVCHIKARNWDMPLDQKLD